MCNNKDLTQCQLPSKQAAPGALGVALVTGNSAKDRSKPEIKVQVYFACSGGEAACSAGCTLCPALSLWGPYGSLWGPSCSSGCFNLILAKLSTTASITSVPPATSAWVKTSRKLALQHWETAVVAQTHLVPEDEPHDGSHQDDEEDEGQEHGVLWAERVG